MNVFRLFAGLSLCFRPCRDIRRRSVILLISYGEGSAPSTSNFRRPSFIGHVYLFFPHCFCSHNMLLISFPFPFLFSLHPVLIFICPHGSRRSFVFFFLLSILCVVLLLLTKLTSSFTLLFPFFLFIYFAYLRISWVCRSHTKSQILSHLPVCAS